MPDIDTSPAALRALAEQMDDVSLIPAKIGDVACDTLRALAAEKEAATVKDGLTVGAEVKPLKAVAVMGVRPPPAQEPSSTVHAPADLRTLAEAATPGPWQVDITRHPYSMVRLDGSFAEGEHVERWIQSVRIDPQAKAPHPIVVRSVGIAHPGEPPIPMVHIRPEDADYLAAVSPEVVLALLDTIDSLRASLAAAEKERDAQTTPLLWWKDHALKVETERDAAIARAEKAEADLKYVNEARTLDLADHQTKIKEMAERIRKAEAERDALAGRRPKVLLHWGPDGDFSWGATDGLDVVCVDERCPNDRVYETTGALSVEVIQRVADGRAQHPIDALDQIAREATTPEDPVHD